MITSSEKEAILAVSKKYSFTHLYLFGSAALKNSGYSDIDLAVEGLSPKEYFSFYGDLLFSLSISVDLIDLSQKNAFTNLVRKDGVLLV